MRDFRLTLAVAAAVAILSSTVAGATAGPIEAGGASAHASAALSGKQKQAKRKALRRCGKKSSQQRRQACRKKVRKRFEQKPLPPKPVEPTEPTDPAARIDVGDDYFAPNLVSIESGDTVLWIWNDKNHDPHNVTMTSGPAGVDRKKFETSGSPAVEYSFWRTFTVPGTYEFACSLHTDMKLTVVVS
ncbi:MAG TPA: plastocyanin/azurin family copper-binding protein [Solirubrobacterales bacterium]|nr:plastocyanin/azurin family copper-binding protein [Solirubrobacterales bacterium]